jgi:hypothetical protein
LSPASQARAGLLWADFSSPRNARWYSVSKASVPGIWRTHFWVPFALEINSHIAVSVDILVEKSVEADTAFVPEPNLHHKSSYSFFGPASSSGASNAASILSRSQTRRPSMRFGRDIRPSSTISSNFVAPTPIYSAAWTRERSRGASDSGR